MKDTSEADTLRDLAALADVITPWAIRVAAALRLADLLADRPRRILDLAERAGADPDALERLLHHLAHHGLFEEREPGLFAVTAKGSLLADDHPTRLRAWLDVTGAGGRMDTVFTDLLDAVRTGTPSYPGRYGQSFWADLGTQPTLSTSFDTLLAHQSASFAAEIAMARDWSTVHHVVDVGGGTGSLLAGILRAHPHLRGTLIDLPRVVEHARSVFAAAGVADRAHALGGSFFDPLPADADVYLLCSVLHDWPDRDAARILRRCVQAARAHGRILVSERIIPDSVPLPAGIEPVTAMDLRMLVIVGGRERSRPAFEALATECGATVTSHRHLPSGRTLLELAPTNTAITQPGASKADHT
ncbi:methyltransferase [Streptomyces sp. NPDC006627]|uniref:methyltransferase n=1 Tax=Streptomyces sp. NPDC006627 TaxID=3154679 RepID=UPI0033B915EB